MGADDLATDDEIIATLGLATEPDEGLYVGDTITGALRDAAKPGLLYIGEGIVAARLLAHWRKTRTPGNLQRDVFSAAKRLECSWVLTA